MENFLYWINLENYSFKIGNAYRRSIIFKVIVHQIGKNIFIPYFTNHGFDKKLFCFLLYWCLLRFHEKKCAAFGRAQTDVSGNGSIKDEENFDAPIFSWNRGVTKWFIHFDEFQRFSYKLMIYFLSLPPIIENHFLLVHLSRCRQAQLLLNPHCCNWAWGFPGTKYKQKEKLVPG